MKNEFGGTKQSGSVYIMWFEGMEGAGVYIGATTRDCEVRWAEHKSGIEKGKHPNWAAKVIIRHLGKKEAADKVRFAKLCDTDDVWGEERREFIKRFGFEALMNGKPPIGGLESDMDDICAVNRSQKGASEKDWMKRFSYPSSLQSLQ